MEFNISKETKLEMANAALNTLQTNFYREILFQGYDPDNFDMEAFRAGIPEGSEGLYGSIFSYSEKINNLKQLIESIQ